MSDRVIRVEGLGKKFYLGMEKAGTIRETVEQIFNPSIREKNAFWAIKDISFEVKQGDVLGIIGRNGAGKSTLLKILSRITPPTTGRIEYRGRIASLLEVGTGFHPELSGRENIYLNGTILGMKHSEITRKLDEIIDFSGIETFIDTPVKRYSSGMYVRLAFAVAAHLEPEILIVDEVLAVGDAEFQKKCLGKMKDVSSKEGRTVLFVSHNLNSVQQLCTSGILLKDGHIAYAGLIDESIKMYRESSESYLERISFVKDPDPRNEITIQSAKIMDSNGTLKASFDFDEDIHLAVQYRVNQPISGSIVNFILSDHNQDLFISFDTDDNLDLFNSRVPGDYISEVVIPANRLKPGHYTLTIGSGIANRKPIERNENCLGFEVFTSRKNYSFSSFHKDRRGCSPIGRMAY